MERAQKDGKQLDDRERDDEHDEKGVRFGRNNATGIVVKALEAVIGIIGSWHQGSIDKVPKEFTEKDAPDTGPYCVDGGKDAYVLTPLVPEKDTHVALKK